MSAVAVNAPAKVATKPGEPRLIINIAAWVCLILTVGLIFLGALVTSYGVGMAVPDGHTTFGQTLWLYRWWDKAFGIQLEHTHRLAGMTVGLAVMATYFLVFFTSPRQYLRWIAAGTFFAVIVQGIIGRYRVNLNELFGTGLAAIHGGCAQIVFLLTTLLVCLTSRWWHEASTIRSAAAHQVQRLAVALVGLTYLQIVVGALFRHRNAGFHLHATIGYLLLIAIMAFGAYVLVREEIRKRLGLMLMLMAAGVVAQIVLGNASALLTGLIPRELRTEITNMQALVTATHLIVGSLFFASTIVTAVVAFRTLRRDS